MLLFFGSNVIREKAGLPLKTTNRPKETNKKKKRRRRVRRTRQKKKKKKHKKEAKAANEWL